MKAGEKIKELRKEKKLTQGELAKNLMLTQDTISRIEKGNREISNSELVAISKFFGVSTDYIFGLTNHKTALDNEEGEIIRAVCDYTGLSEKAIKVLHFLKTRHIRNKSNSLYTQNDKYSYFYSSDFISEILENINHLLLSNSITNYSTSKYDTLKIFDEICSIEKIQSKEEYYSLSELLRLGTTNLKFCKIAYIEIVEEIQRCISTALDYNSEVFSEKQTEAFNKILELNVDYGGENNGNN